MDTILPQINENYLGNLDNWYFNGAQAYGFINGEKTPIKTNWVVKIDRTGHKLYTKAGWFNLKHEIWDEAEAKKLFKWIGF